MSSDIDSEVAPDHWWLHRQTDDEHFVFAYEFSKTVLCHVQQTSEWMVQVDRADGTILFSQHNLKSREAAVDLAQSIIELCTMLHREVVTGRSQARKPMYVGSCPTGAANASNRMTGQSPDSARRPSDSRPRQPPIRPRVLDHREGEFR